MKTQVCIIGGGPSGLMLSQILDAHNIENIILERQSIAYVKQRIRAGVLETGTVEMLNQYGLGERMAREGHFHDGVIMSWQGKQQFLLDTYKTTGKRMMAYGQTAITEDLYEKRAVANAVIIENATNVQPHDMKSNSPYVTYSNEDKKYRIDCEFIAGCDGYHGVCRTSIPEPILKTYERVYPFGWLGIMAETPPYPTLVYAQHRNGFALASQRSPMLSRYYIQIANGEKIEDWSDDRFWQELKTRLPENIAQTITTGPSIEKSIAPLRSFVCEPMRYGQMFLVGDAAHIVPPTGAKGLNLAFSDVYYLSRALEHFYNQNSDSLLDDYSDIALKRVWSSIRFSWWMTNLMHHFPDSSDFEQKLRHIEFQRLFDSETMQTTISEEYIGLPF